MDGNQTRSMASQISIPTTEISALVLAGGRGNRMGGMDKGLISIAGKPAIEHVLQRLRPQLETILISANRNLERYARYGYPVIEDTLSEFPGPLAGIAAGLHACNTKYLLCMPVDAPLLGDQYVVRMKTCLEKTGGPACVAEFNGKPEPVFCLLHKCHEQTLLEYLGQGKRSVQVWLKKIGAHVVDFNDSPDQFININLEQDQQKLETSLQHYG
ncbi:MAG: molybdenum cofactor guanylyltransferase [Gammaproteobacteria bacterium]|nr:MAG: molybdenum cofactor guanylyltransferase [Gammaproteobacteria bacterium]